jgi:hypothetical protein
MKLQNVGIALVLSLLPATAYAQAAITGIVKDASGAVLQGATVEAVSPVLIEKVRSVVSDGTGQYRIVDLRPGIYSVTFRLPGFSTVKREGIELSGSFVATVNGDLKIGALEETLTVRAETPIVDVQSARAQQMVGKDIIAAIPSSRNAGGIQALIPGMSSPNDSGGINGTGGAFGSAGTIHGGRGSDSRTYADGLDTGWAGGNTSGAMPNVAGAQEVVINTSGGSGEAETAGVVLNVIPRDGGNTFSGLFFASGANGAMQGSNYTQALKDAGLKTPQELKNVWEVNPMGGGRIVRDRLWFYLTYREIRGDSTVPGMWVNKNAGNPNAWTVDFDKSRPAFYDNLERNGIARITWQATPRNKINLYWSEIYVSNQKRGGGSPTVTPEASIYSTFHPNHVQQATWSSPLTNRVLLEAGWGTWQSRYRNPQPRVDGTHNPRMIRTLEQGSEIPNLIFRMPGGVGGGFNHHLVGTIAATRASISYVTGAHSVKVGYQGGFMNPSQEIHFFNEIIAVRVNNGVPNRLTQTIAYPGTAKYVRNLLPTSFYAQDQRTTGRLTLQGAVRYDHLITTYPESHIGGPGYAASAPVEIRYASRSTPGISWDDVTPRVGVAYDLFGTGKTALKFNIGKYMQALALTPSNQDFDLNPLIRTTTSTTRSWTDTNRDFVANCDLANPNRNGECGEMADKNLGKEVFNRSYDLALIHGYGNRPYSWGLGASIQQEVVGRVSVNVGYFRNWWGNWYAVDNRETDAADYTPYSVMAPVDARLPNGGGQTISGLYDLIPGRVGQVDELAQHSNNLTPQIENWQGVDVNVNARLRNGVTVQGGTSTGRKLNDSCALKAALPEQGTGVNGANTSIAGGSLTNPYCRVVEPFQTQIRGLATYLIPRIGVQVSGTWSSTPGLSLAANYTVSNAIVKQSLGRDLSGGASNVSVNLIPPSTYFADRRNNIDLRFSKIVRYGRTRTQFGLDVYNAMNTDVVTGYNQVFVPNGSWLTPTDILPARYVRANVLFDF